MDDKPAKTEDDIKQWDTEFVKVDQATLFDLILVSERPPSFSLTTPIPLQIHWAAAFAHAWLLTRCLPPPLPIRCRLPTT